MISIYLSKLFSNFVVASFFPFFSLWLFQSHLLSISEVALITCVCVMMARVPAILIAKMVAHFDKTYLSLAATFLLLLNHIAILLCAEWKLSSLLLWIILAAFLGLLASVNTLTLLAKVANLSRNAKEKHHRFSMMNVAMNLSGGFGPFFGALLFAQYHAALPLLPILFCMISLGCMYYLPKDQVHVEFLTVVDDKEKKLSSNHNLFAKFLLIIFFTFFAYPQFYNIFPVYAKNYFSAEFIGAMFLVGSLMTAFFQLCFNRLIQNLSFIKLLVAANIILMLGTGALALVQFRFMPVIILGVSLCCIAQLIYVPVYQTICLELSEKNSSHALAWMNFTWGIAETVATFLGIYLVGIHLGFISYLLGCLSCLIATLFLARWR